MPTERQASSLDETASSMEELTGTVQQNAENARMGWWKEPRPHVRLPPPARRALAKAAAAEWEAF